MLPQILLFIAHIVAGDKYSSQKYFLLEVMGNISYVLIFMFAEFTFVVGLPILTLVCCGICGKLYGIRTAEIAAVSGYILGLICVLLMYGQDFMAFFF